MAQVDILHNNFVVCFERDLNFEYIVFRALVLHI